LFLFDRLHLVRGRRGVRTKFPLGINLGLALPLPKIYFLGLMTHPLTLDFTIIYHVNVLDGVWRNVLAYPAHDHAADGLIKANLPVHGSLDADDCNCVVASKASALEKIRNCDTLPLKDMGLPANFIFHIFRTPGGFSGVSRAKIHGCLFISTETPCEYSIFKNGHCCVLVTVILKEMKSIENVARRKNVPRMSNYNS